MNTRTQTLLSTLWIFIILNIFARDIHELGRPGMLEQVLKYRVNRCVNIIVGLIAIAIVVMSNLSPDLDNIFFMIIEMIALLAIIGIAWRWKIETF